MNPIHLFIIDKISKINSSHLHDHSVCLDLVMSWNGLLQENFSYDELLNTHLALGGPPTNTPHSFLSTFYVTIAHLYSFFISEKNYPTIQPLTSKLDELYVHPLLSNKKKKDLDIFYHEITNSHHTSFHHFYQIPFVDYQFHPSFVFSPTDEPIISYAKHLKYLLYQLNTFYASQLQFFDSLFSINDRQLIFHPNLSYSTLQSILIQFRSTVIDYFLHYDNHLHIQSLLFQAIIHSNKQCLLLENSPT